MRITLPVSQLAILVAALSLAIAPSRADEPKPGVLKEPRYLLEWGSKGAKPGEFYSPVCIAINAKDEVFVADLNNCRIQQFTTDGKHVGGFDLPRDQKDRNSCMVGGLSVDADGNLYVSFMIQHKIGVYSKDGKLLHEWGKKGTGNGEFNQPGGSVLQSDGTFVVADQCNHRVQVFTTAGKFVRKWGEHGSKPGQFGGLEAAGSRFAGPHFLAQDSKGRLYTTEGVTGRVQQFSADGTPLTAWGDKKKEPGAFGEYQFGKLKNTFGPIGVFVDKQDRVWVSSLNDRVQGFTPDGKLLYRLDGTEEIDPFRHPHGMATDSKGYFYIGDAGNQRIVKFELPPR